MAEARNEIPEVAASIPGMGILLVVPRELTVTFPAAWAELCLPDEQANAGSSGFNASTLT
jgi:hypothetical protein